MDEEAEFKGWRTRWGDVLQIRIRRPGDLPPPDYFFFAFFFELIQSFLADEATKPRGEEMKMLAYGKRVCSASTADFEPLQIDISIRHVHRPDSILNPQRCLQIDVLVTQGQPHQRLDLTSSEGLVDDPEAARAIGRTRPRLVVIGHVRRSYGVVRQVRSAGLITRIQLST
jgi:hypothetical protein